MREVGLIFGIALLFLIAGTFALLPVWIFILTFVGLGIFAATEAAAVLRGSGIDGAIANTTTGIKVNDFEQTASARAQSLYQRNLSLSPLKQNWNCKNCGGPNIDQVKCQYCGMVKE